MQEFSATDAAFEGFRVARERPRAILVWAAVGIAMGVVQYLLVATLGGQPFNDFMQAAQSGVTDRAQILHLEAELLPFTAVMIPLSLLFYGVMSAAIFRVVLEPQTAGTGLRFGVQELRQVGMLVAMAVIIFLVNLGLLFLVGAAVGLGTMVNAALGKVLGSVALLAWLATLVYVTVRLSLAGPQTFAERRIRVFDSWHLTRGHFWPMAGAYLLAIAFSMIVLLLGMVVLGGLLAAAGGQATDLVKPPTTLAGFFTPMRVLYLVGWAFLTTLTRAILLCPMAVIYRQLHE